jgi:hypothetical protein
MKRRAWADSPIRFTNDPAFGSISDQVQFKLLTWYMEKEEDAVTKRKKRTPESSKVMNLGTWKTGT